MRSEGLIVVGVDGSESAQAALEFALKEAARWSAHVRAVTAFHPPEYWPVVYGVAGGMVVPPTTAERAADAERTARQALVDATARTVPVDVRVVPGSAGQVLLDQTVDADLLVVGHRGRGGIASACLGSVGLQCVLHAACPVVVRCAQASAARAEFTAVLDAARA